MLKPKPSKVMHSVVENTNEIEEICEDTGKESGNCSTKVVQSQEPSSQPQQPPVSLEVFLYNNSLCYNDCNMINSQVVIYLIIIMSVTTGEYFSMLIVFLIKTAKSLLFYEVYVT